MSFFVIVYRLPLLLRHMISELDNPSLRFIGGVAMILLIFSRTFFNRTKRKFI